MVHNFCILEHIHGLSFLNLQAEDAMISSANMTRTIEDQVGVELAKEQGGRLGFVKIYRPYATSRDDCIIHRGMVENFLINPRHRNGIWVIEITSVNPPLLVGVKWNDNTNEWEKLGRVSFGIL